LPVEILIERKEAQVDEEEFKAKHKSVQMCLHHRESISDGLWRNGAFLDMLSLSQTSARPPLPKPAPTTQPNTPVGFVSCRRGVGRIQGL